MPSEMNARRLTVGSLFAGIGGIELGLEMTRGFRTCWQVEKEPYARRVLAKHWPHATRHEDVKDVGRHNLEPVDLIACGFPCQPFSQAGKRAGSSDERYLWPEAARIIDELRPRWVLLENVPGLLGIDDGRTFGRILADLAALGFDAEWECLPASAFGAHHERQRLFVVAYPEGQYGPARRCLGASGEERASLQSRRLHGLAVATRGQAPHSRLESEPEVDRMVHDVPYRVVSEQLRVLGNAVVPQVARYIGMCVLAAGGPDVL